MISWTCKAFSDLTVYELYDILRLRSEVFVVEQACVFQDPDGKDISAFHLMGQRNGELVAYTRLLGPGKSYDEMSIGRVVNSSKFRNEGIGRELMRESIERIRSIFGNGDIRIGAQLYLKKFYESFGFVQQGEPYLEDGIEHIYMLLAKPHAQ